MPYDAPFTMAAPKPPGQIERMRGPGSIEQIEWTERFELHVIPFKMYSLQSEVQSMPKAFVGGASEASSRVSPSRSASVTALASVVVTLVGIAGQMVDAESAAFATIAAFGLAVLAAIVLIHQRA